MKHFLLSVSVLLPMCVWAESTISSESGDGGVKVVDFKLDTPVYLERPFGVMAKAVNESGTDVTTDLSLCFLGGNNNEVVASCTIGEVTLAPGESKELPKAVSVATGELSVGTTYSLVYVDMRSGVNLSQPVEVTVQANPDYGALATNSEGFSIVDADAVALDDFRANFDLYCRRGYYSDRVDIFIFSEDLSEKIAQLQSPDIYFIGAKSWIHEQNVKFPKPDGLEVGKRYGAALYYLDEGWPQQCSNAVYFTVASESGGIGDVAADNAGDSIQALPDGDKMYVTGARDLRSVEVYNPCGARVAISTTSVVDMSGVPRGIYIVRILTANGEVSLKTVK